MKLNFPGCCRGCKLRPIKPASFYCNSFQAAFGTGKNMCSLYSVLIKDRNCLVVKALINN